MKLYFTTIIVFLFSSLFGQAMWNESLPIRQSGNLEWYNSSILTENDEMIHVWSETIHQTRDIFATKLDSEGNSLWGEEPILVSNSSGNKSNPKVITTSDGGCVVVWEDYLSYHNKLKAQKLNSSGSILWSEEGIILAEDYEGFFTQMFPNNNGGAIIVWAEEVFKAVSLNSNGVNQWNGNDVELNIGNISNPNINQLRQVTSDGFGGLLVTRKSGTSNASVDRIEAGGELLWTQVIELNTFTSFYPYAIDAIYNNIDAYYIIVKGIGALTDDGMATSLFNISKILLGGDLVSSGDRIMKRTPGLYQFTSTCPVFTTNNNGDLFVFDRFGGPEFYDRDYNLTVYSLDSQLNHLWDESGVILCNSGQYASRDPFTIDCDDSGNLFVLTPTRILDIHDVYHQQLSLFSIDATGTIQTPENGLAISPGSNGKPYLKKADNLFVTWYENAFYTMNLKQQVFDDNLESIMQEGNEVVKSSLGAGIERDTKITTYPMTSNESVITLWNDFEETDMQHIMYQKINPDGSVDFTASGIAIAESDINSQELYVSTQNDSGEICVAWVSGDNMIKSRTISTDGSLVGSDSGEIVYEYLNSDVSITNLSLSSYANEFYLGWSSQGYAPGYEEVYALRTTQGGSEWIAQPIVISPYNLSQLQSIEMINNYLIYKYDVNYSVYKIGIEIAINMGEFPTSSEVEFACDTANNIFYTWHSNESEVFLQGIPNFSSTNPVFNQPIAVSYHGGPGQKIYARFPQLSVADNEIFVSWKESFGFSTDNELRAQKISYSGQKEWAPEGLLLTTQDNISDYCITPGSAQAPNDFVVATWTELFDNTPQFKVNLINDSGALLLGSQGVNLMDNEEKMFSLNTTLVADNQIMYTWVREPTTNIFTIFRSIQAQMFDFTTVDNDNNDSEPLTLNLLQNYPNPFNPETTIAFNVPNSGLVKLEVYNLKGQKVKTLLNDNLSSGKHSVVWNGRDNNNKHVASGVYFYRLKSGVNSQTNKMILMK